MKKAKVSVIEKKYKDKKTGEIKQITINYSKVKDRLLEFWTDNPYGRIDTVPSIMMDRLMFKAYITTNKNDSSVSKDATGHALGSESGEKDFERLETIAVGRALALLGYGSDGEIASSEEMEEFEEYKKNKLVELIFESQEKLYACKTEKELRNVWASLPVEAKNALVAIKDEVKLRLSENDNKKVQG